MIAKNIKLLNLKPDEKERAMSDLKKICKNCTMCDLAKTRDKVVFGSGNPKADIVLIGEAPGAEEDASGLPFVGRAGKFLTQIMEKAGLDRKKDLFIINTVKCRPPENRVPTDLEKNYCEDYLMSQLAIINPKVIILCGATACETFFDKTFWKKNRISNLRGDFFENQGIQFVPVFHPSYLLRQHSEEKDAPRSLTLQDFINIKEYVKNLNTSL